MKLLFLFRKICRFFFPYSVQWDYRFFPYTRGRGGEGWGFIPYIPEVIPLTFLSGKMSNIKVEIHLLEVG